MQFIRNSYYHNVIPEPTDAQGILKYIEKIGRLCYRSDDLIEDDSAESFIDRLKARGHLAMLEHYIFTIEIPEGIYLQITNSMWMKNPHAQDYPQKLKYVNITPSNRSTLECNYYLISGSATAFSYLWNTKCVREGWNKGMIQICEFLNYYHPHLMVDPFNKDRDCMHATTFDPKIRFLSREEVKKLPTELRKVHDWMSVHFNVERSSTHDLVRHRHLTSYAQESTRYCNYDKKGLCFVLPCEMDEKDKKILENQDEVDRMCNLIDNNAYWDEDLEGFNLSDVALEWFKTLYNTSNSYTALLNTYHKSPQEAKSVLPQCLRAEINITTFMNEWHHIFTLRASKAAYPQIQEVMVPLLDETIVRDPKIFSDLYYLIEEKKQ